ncbi:MAG: hypothetical protein ABWK00_00070 [Desulfurococcaceae archaeon]
MRLNEVVLAMLLVFTLLEICHGRDLGPLWLALALSAGLYMIVLLARRRAR